MVQLKGVQMDIRDQFDYFRISKDQTFIIQMRSKEQECEKEKNGEESVSPRYSLNFFASFLWTASINLCGLMRPYKKLYVYIHTNFLPTMHWRKQKIPNFHLPRISGISSNTQIINTNQL